MNQKEINELRRRFRPEKSAISRVYGCYVNSSKEIVSDLDESLGMMPQEESEKYLSLLKKGLSGSLGKNHPKYGGGRLYNLYRGRTGKNTQRTGQEDQ